MRCIECGENEATIVSVQGTGRYWNVRRAGDPEVAAEPEERSLAAPAAEGGSDAATESAPRGPNVCESCARRRYDERRGVGTPTWEEFRRLFA